MNRDLEQQLTSIRRVLVDQFPRQCREGAVDPSQWMDLHIAAEWLAENTFSLTAAEAHGFNDLLLWVQSTVNEMLAWMSEQIDSGKSDDGPTTKELCIRFERLWSEYDGRARKLLGGGEETDEQQPPRPVGHSVRRPIMERPIHIFFSYAHEDEALMNEVRLQLIVRERIGEIVKWHDRMIPPGNEWRNEIDYRIEEAHVILLFMSPNFLASRYCYETEGTVALRRHREGSASVIPVVLRACDWTVTPFGELQALPTDGIPFTQWPDRDQASLDIAQGIMKTVTPN